MATLDELRGTLESTRRRFAEALKSFEAAGGRYINRAAPLSQALVENCKVMADRYEMLEHLPKDAVCAEVGTDKGDFARRILDTCSPRHLHVFELDATRINPHNLMQAQHAHRCSLHIGDSVEGLGSLKDGDLDWIYIDGDHSYAGVKRDIAAADPKVRPGGLIVFNDYCVWSVSSMRQCGVAQAVNELAIQQNYKFVFFAFQVSGYCDVALQKS